MGSMDELINPSVVAALAASMSAASPLFESSALKKAQGALADQRLRDRVSMVRDAVLDDVPAGFDNMQSVITAALELPGFAGWMIWPVTEAVSASALASATTHDFDSGMALLARLTPRLSSEFAIRDMLNARPERAVDQMTSWVTNENEHVRRLATEGSRAYLPWARKVAWLIDHPRATGAILDAAYRDPSEYVRRSTANHLNDLSRVDAAAATDAARRWAAQPDSNTAWVTRHGLRTLIKRADPVALTLVGFAGTDLTVEAPRLSRPSLSWGGSLEFAGRVANHGSVPANVAIDYVVGFVRANGSTSRKTFKLATRGIAPGESVEIIKTHSFRPITTRTYYPGIHSVSIQANGIASPPAYFSLEAGN